MSDTSLGLLWDPIRLRLLVEIDHQGSVSAAARSIGIGQPTASEHLRLLEAAAGQRLVERNGRGSSLTDAGRVLALHAAQALATLRDLGLPDDAEHVNPNGGAIALGHPLGMSGARLVTTAMYELHRRGGRYALCTMCIGVGQGIAAIIERV